MLKLMMLIVLFATQVSLAKNKLTIESIDAEYNRLAKLSVEQAFKNSADLGALFPDSLFLSKADREYVNSQLKNIEKSELPKIEFKENQIILESENEELQISVIHALKGEFKIGDTVINTGKYPSLESQAKLIERILKQKNKSVHNQPLRWVLGEPAQAAIPLLIWGGVAVVSWSKAAYEACKSELICTSDESKISGSLGAINKYVELASSGGSVEVQASCRKPKRLAIYNQGSKVPFYSSNSSDSVETNMDTGAMSYTTIATEFNKCCQTHERKCESLIATHFKGRNQRFSNDSSNVR